MSENSGYEDDASPPEQTADDTDVGWGEVTIGDEDEARILREKPPHY